MKISKFLSENFQFLVVKFSINLNRRVFVMDEKQSSLEERMGLEANDKISCNVRKRSILDVHPTTTHTSLRIRAV